jgi:hypothetical protein
MNKISAHQKRQHEQHVRSFQGMNPRTQIVYEDRLRNINNFRGE